MPVRNENNATLRIRLANILLDLATFVRGDEELQANWDMSELGYRRMAQSYEDEMLARAYEDEELVNPNNAPF